jgi:hypothetical protein
VSSSMGLANVVSLLSVDLFDIRKFRLDGPLFATERTPVQWWLCSACQFKTKTRGVSLTEPHGSGIYAGAVNGR